MATKVRHVRISDELWQAAKDKAWSGKTSAGAAVNAFLIEWTGCEPAEQDEEQKRVRAAIREEMSRR